MTTDTKLATRDKKISPIDAAVLDIMETFRKREARLELLLPPKADVQRFKESVRFALAQQPSLVKCTPQSLVLAVMRGARTGLPVDGGGGLAWIVPYGTEATYVPGYKGLITLAKATGLVKDMQPIPVYKRDVFKYRPADDQPVEHEVYEPETDDPADDRGPLRAVYCKTTLPDGSRRYTVMYLKDIKIIQAKSRAKNGPWASDFVPMALKSVVKMDFKTLGVPPGDTYKALRVALAADTAADTGEVDSELRDMEEQRKPSASESLREKLKRADEAPPSEPLLVERGGAETLAPHEFSDEMVQELVDSGRIKVDHPSKFKPTPGSPGDMTEKEKAEAIAAEFEASKQ
jgi:recombination protein RecT